MGRYLASWGKQWPHDIPAGGWNTLPSREEDEDEDEDDDEDDDDDEEDATGWCFFIRSASSSLALARFRVFLVWSTYDSGVQ
jgi:hypothetical protein